MKKLLYFIQGRDEYFRRTLPDLFKRHGFELVKSGDPQSLTYHCHTDPPHLVIIGPTPDNATQIAAQLRRHDNQTPIILITQNLDPAMILAALRAGVNDYFTIPLAVEDLLVSAQRLAGKGLLPNSGPPALQDLTMVGKSVAMAEVKQYIPRVAAAESNVLITGETGTGKELAAAMIHRHSPRKDQPLVCINCAAIPDTLLESELFGHERGAFTGAHAHRNGMLQLAEGGTVLFDEIGDMSQHAQAKVLRAIESREILRLGGKRAISLNIRVLAATNQNLENLVAAGKFRQDLYFRLNVAQIHLPPLNERKEDLLLLIDHFIRDFNRRFGLRVQNFTEEALAFLFRYHWPGNVRELKNLIEAIFINRPPRSIGLFDLPPLFRQRLKETRKLAPSERDALLGALFATNWNKSQAAQRLNWSRMTLYRKMEKYRITSSRGKAPTQADVPEPEHL
jgi:DNA-binding NtrC family response regulator